MKDSRTTLVWDVATRLFHVFLLALVSVCLYTGLSGGLDEMDLHMVCGYGVLALILFRIIWGFAGSTHARFSSFVVSPARTLRHAQGIHARLRRNPRSREIAPSLGHNPMGGYSVIMMLLLLLAQATTGLFASDDIFIEGPLMHLVSDDQSQTLTGFHKLFSKVIMVIIGLHVFAVVCHEIFLKDRILIPMVTGRKRLEEHSISDARDVNQKPLLALVLFALVVLAVYVLVDALWW